MSTANCFQHSPALQPRAYIVIGGIGLGHQMEIDADLVSLRDRVMSNRRLADAVPPFRSSRFVRDQPQRGAATDPLGLMQILTTLRSRIRLGSKNDGALAAVIIQCLVKTLPGLATEASFWHSLFWSARLAFQRRLAT